MLLFDAGTASTTQNTTSLSYSHTVATNANRLAIFIVRVDDPTGDVVTGVTFDNPATRIDRIQSLNGEQIYAYYLFDPPQGTNNVVVARSPSGNISSSVATFYGYKTAALDSSASSTNTATSFGPATTVVAPNASLITSLYGTPTSAEGALRIQGAAGYIYQSLGTVPPGSRTITFTGASQLWGGITVSIAVDVSGNFFFNLV